MGDEVTAARREFLTVEQAAEVCGIGRTVAYELARRAADHGEGELPAVRFGKQLRVPRQKLEELIGGPISLPTDPPVDPTPTNTGQPIGSGYPTAGVTSTRHSAASVAADQPSLPFTTA